MVRGASDSIAINEENGSCWMWSWCREEAHVNHTFHRQRKRKVCRLRVFGLEERDFIGLQMQSKQKSNYSGGQTCSCCSRASRDNIGSRGVGLTAEEGQTLPVDRMI